MPMCEMVYGKSGSADEWPCENRATLKCQDCGKNLCVACAEQCSDCTHMYCPAPCLAEHVYQGECHKPPVTERSLIDRMVGYGD